MEATQRPLNVVQINDKELTHIALGHLKGYYKYRERAEKGGETYTATDVQSDSGLIADGYLKFKLKEDSDFVATIEATDYWHREELRYKHTIDLLFVDALTIAFALVAGVLGYYYFDGHISFFHLGLNSSIFYLLLSIIGLAAINFFLLWPIRRYRYIYAIEQFKNYYANDQWIVFAFDVFPNYDDKYFVELRRQCIRYGFGLIEVNNKKVLKVHLTASRVDVVKNNRELVEFKQITSLTKTVTNTVGNLSTFRQGLSYFNWRTNLLRFRRTYYNQLAITGTCFLLICGIIYEEIQKSPVVYIDRDEYEQQQMAAMEELKEEMGGILYYFKIDSGVFVRESSEYLTPSIVYDPESEPIDLAPVNKSIVSVYQAGVFEDQACEEYTKYVSGQYLIFFGSYYNLDEAKRNAVLLRNKGIGANVAWAECFFYGRPFYLLFLENLFLDGTRASEEVRRLAGRLKQQQLNYEVGYSRISR